MNGKRVLVGVALVALLLSVGSVSAQRGPSVGERGLIRAALAAAVAETGLDRAAIVEQLQAGRTLADIVTEAGGDVQTVIAAAVVAGQARIDTALANGRITAEQADALTAELTTGVTSAVHGEITARWVGRGAVRLAASRILLQAMVDETGLTSRDILSQSRDGVSLSAIAEANGSTADAVIEAAMTTATERVNQAVANGTMTQAQADILLSGLPGRYAQAMDAVIATPVLISTNADV